MSNKNSNPEATKNVAAETTMSNEQMEQFVKDNYSIVPPFQRRKFNSLTLEGKVEKIHYYIDYKKKRLEIEEKNKLENRVKDLFIRRKATTEDVVRVIDFCKKFIETTKAEEMKKLQAEIDRLTHLKQTLENN